MKLLVDLSMFALKCEHVKILQDFIVWPKFPQTEMSLDENGPDRNGSDRIGQTESARPNRPDRKVAYPIFTASW